MNEDKKDQDLWQAVADSVRPLNDKGSKKYVPKHVSLQKKLTLKIQKPKHDVDVDFSTHKELRSGDINAMDRNTAFRFRNGEMHIDATLDLHGYTLEKAKDVLKKFIYSQNKQNARCLLLITGKGGRLGKGLLRAELPIWLNSPDLRSLILSYLPAKPKDGGDGAFYVLLKRNRKY